MADKQRPFVFTKKGYAWKRKTMIQAQISLM
jgi:hypothetical protein